MLVDVYIAQLHGLLQWRKPRLMVQFQKSWGSVHGKDGLKVR